MSASIAPVRGLLLVLRRPGRILALLAAFVGAVTYVWIAAVRAAPRARRKKAASRRSRGAAPWKG
jgi:hypothetical protein